MASFKKIGKDNWMFRWKYKDKTTGKQREVKRQGFRTKPEATAAYEELKRTIELGYDSAQNEKIVEFLEFWLSEYKKDKVAVNTYRLHERNIQNHIAPYFKNMLLRDLTHPLYQKFINHLIAIGYSKRTVEIIHGTMFSAMKKAKTAKKIQTNPCEDITIYSTKEKREKDNLSSRVKFIPYDKIGDFLDAALLDNPLYYLFFRFLIETGVRKGEALALQWGHLDLINQRVKIEQTIDYEAKTDDELFGETKTYHSKREIPITKRLAAELKAHKVRQNDNKLRFKDAYKHELDLVFCRQNGTTIPKSTLFNAFRRILNRVGLPNLDIHSLRHTHAVLLLESKAEMKYIQEALGHSSMKITSDVYSHVSKKIESDAIASFEKHTEEIFKEGAEWGRNKKPQ
ncbi:site-specific integrase [Cytobacillus sp. FSL W8-0315]|uniref:tyrosine-type recombinase/integrase n=1 Tax=Cytobacillus sp. FSL W8-0315 TaxID=2921600 RepID=UPI0030FBC856